MKTLTNIKMVRKMMLAMSVVILTAVMAACGGSKVPSAAEVASKIDAGQTLTEADYTSMIDYCGEYAKKAQGYFDIINAQPNDSTAESIKATSDLAGLYDDYKYLDMFRNTLANTEVTAMGAANEKKINELAQYQAFPLPEGEGADLENPQVVGMIEDMPDTDTAGVIANGDGEAVNTNVK